MYQIITLTYYCTLGFVNKWRFNNNNNETQNFSVQPNVGY